METGAYQTPIYHLPLLCTCIKLLLFWAITSTCCLLPTRLLKFFAINIRMRVYVDILICYGTTALKQDPNIQIRQIEFNYLHFVMWFIDDMKECRKSRLY